ncbi:MAG: hypothetical protein IPJ74_09210 [Saprospiraceae bacterium]|nr:hypothetical protein [Saprospiraceae bacterium]
MDFNSLFSLQLPSIILLIQASELEEARQLISFNLSGPLCLMIAGIYFLHRRFKEEDITDILKIFYYL